MNSRHIHIVVKYFLPVIAGIETNILETYSVLVQNGWKVTIHTSKNTHTERNILPDNDLIRGLVIKRYPYHWYGFFPDIPLDKPILVCLHNFNLSHLFLLIQLYFLKIIFHKRIVLVVTPHGGYNPEWSIFTPLNAYVKKTLHMTIGKYLLNHTADAVRAVSMWEYEEMKKSGINTSKLITISNGVEDEAYLDVDSLASDSVKKYVKKLGRYMIQIGRIYKIKNYETVIKALPHIPTDIKFLIIGSSQGNDDYKNYLQSLAYKLGVQDRLFFYGVARGVDKFYLIRHALLMVHMAIWESFCNVVHEGLSQGLVCIVADAYALPYLIKDKINGFLVGTFDFRTLAAKINFVLENSGLKEISEMKKRNQEFGLQDSWRNVAGRMNDLYQNLLNNIT